MNTWYWTKKHPTKNGIYWCRRPYSYWDSTYNIKPGDIITTLVEVKIGDDPDYPETFYMYMGTELYDTKPPENAEWWGPIEPPSYP